MRQKILVLMLKFALARLGENLAADEQLLVAYYNRRRAEVEKTEDAAAIELGKIETRINQLDAERRNNILEIEFLESEIKNQDEKIRVVAAKH